MTLAKNRWQRVKEVFGGALDTPTRDREQYLDDVCAGDDALRVEVSSLLAAHADESTFLDRSALQHVPDSMVDQIAHHWVGRRVGAYQIVESIGRGGMGEVFKAVRADEQYQQQVAIKLVRGGYDSDFILRRFKAERQILATLDHPNIARLLDGGVTDEGLPYLVMELVGGEPIDRYCDERNLSINARLALFRTVCAAAQYAHQRLVVHRDLKPSNVLVTANGTVKLLDFGIAKLIDASGGTGNDATVTVLRALTPEYSSPEQIRGEPAATPSDVYSLGVVLYRLLTGTSPYRTSSTDAFTLAKAVCEADPLRPSAAARAQARSPLDADLDAIVLKALRKQPEARYGSVERLSDDVRRHIEHEPVLARQGGWSYRASRYVARHTFAVAAAAMLGLAIAAGVATTAYQATVARAERDRAESERARAEKHFAAVRKLANGMLTDIDKEIRDIPGSLQARRQLLKMVLDYLGTLSADVPSDPAVRLDLGLAYMLAANTQGGVYLPNIGDPESALVNYAKSIELLSGLVAQRGGNREALRELVDAYRLLGVLQIRQGLPGGLDTLKRAVLAGNNLIASGGATREDIEALGAALLEYGRNKARLHGKDGEAIESIGRAKQLYSQWLRDHPEDTFIMEHLAWTASEYGHTYARQDKSKPNAATALTYYQQALETYERLVAQLAEKGPRRGMASASINVANMLLRLDKPVDAIPYLTRATDVFEELARADATNRQAAEDVAFVLSVLGQALSDAGRDAECEPVLRRSIAEYKRLLTLQPADRSLRFWLTRARQHYAKHLMKWAASAPRDAAHKALQSARELVQESVADTSELVQHAPGNNTYARTLEELTRMAEECEALLASHRPVSGNGRSALRR